MAAIPVARSSLSACKHLLNSRHQHVGQRLAAPGRYQGQRGVDAPLGVDEDDVFLAREVVEERLGGDAGGRGDLGDGSSLITLPLWKGVVMSEPRQVFFESSGQRCAADLYWPNGAEGQVPCVVMGHGGSGTKRLGLPRYAEKFAARGMAVLAFDYRGWGASAGEPRQVIDVAAQRDDYRAAIGYVRGNPGIDPQRVALWGTSLSGGHVLAVAATDPAIAAVVSQVPMIDGWHRGRTLRQRLNWEVTGRTLQFAAAAIRDLARAWKGRAPYLVAVTAEPGQVAIFTEPEARATFEALGGEAAGWRNAAAPRFLFALPRYRKGTAERLSMPVLMCLADLDLQASSKFAARIAAKMPAAKVLHYPAGHFGVYLDPLFEEISNAEADFLADNLRARTRARHTVA